MHAVTRVTNVNFQTANAKQQKTALEKKTIFGGSLRQKKLKLNYFKLRKSC